MSDAPRKIAVVSPSGKAGLLSEEDLDGAMQAGFRLETPEESRAREDEAKYGDRDVAAFAAGAARGATLGLSDLALTKTGLVESETLKGLQQHNEGASIAGDVAGSVGSMLIPGVGAFSGAGLAARAGAGAARAATAIGGGKIAARAALGLAEGAVFGVGSAISEDVLEDGNLDLAGEKLLTHVGLGAVLGGGLNAGGAAIEKALSKTLRRVGGRAAGAVDDVAEAVPVPGLGSGAADPTATGTAGRRFRVPDIEDLDDEALSGLAEKHATTIKDVIGRVVEFPTPENLVTRDLDFQRNALHRMKKKGVAEFGARELLDDARYAGAKDYGEKTALLKAKKGEAAQEIDKAITFFDEAATPAERWNPSATADRIEKEVLSKLQKGPAANEPIAKRVQAEVDRLRKIAADASDEAAERAHFGDDVANYGADTSFRGGEEYKRGLDAHIDWNQTDSNEIKATAKAMRQVRGILNEDLESGVQAIADRVGNPDAFGQWKLAKRRYGAMSEFSGAAEKREAAREANRYFSLTDYLAGGAAVSGALDMTDGDADVLGTAKLGIGMLGNKWARERLAHVMALHLDKLAKNKTAQVAAKSFAGAFKKAEAQAAEATAKAAAVVPGTTGEAAQAAGTHFWSKYGPALSTAATKGANTLYAAHAAFSAADPEYGEAAQTAGFLKETPDDTRAGMRKASQIAAVQEAAAEHDATVADAVAGFLKGGGRPASSKRLSLKEFKTRLDELSDLVANPGALMERLQGGSTLTGSAPGVATAMASTAARAVQFLHGKAPKNPNPPGLPGMERNWEPSEGELSKWARYAQAVDDPRSVLEEMKKGTVTREAVEALRAVYPKLAQDVQARLTNALTENKRTLSYGQKVAIATLMGQQLEPTMSAQSVAALQAAHATAQQQQRPPTTGQRIRLQSGATTSQRLEGKS